MYKRFYGPAHAHNFTAQTSETMNHSHSISIFTYPVNGTGTDGHFHLFQGTTSVENGHFHRLAGGTGPAILLPNGSHVHAIYALTNDEPFEFKGGYYETVLTIERHTHTFIGRTGVPLGFEPPNW